MIYLFLLGCEDTRNQQWNVWALGTVWSGDGEDNGGVQGTVQATAAGVIIQFIFTGLCVLPYCRPPGFLKREREIAVYYAYDAVSVQAL